MITTISDVIFNGLLMGSTANVLFKIDHKEHPFAFCACAMGFCHVCINICSTILKKSQNLERLKRLSQKCFDIISVPMINITLYQSSQQNNALALGHATFIVPLAFDLAQQLWDLEDESVAAGSTEVLKDLTALGNMVSLLFYSVNETNMSAGCMAFAALFANYGAILLDSFLPGVERSCNLGGYAVFYAFLPSALLAGNVGVVVS